MKKYYNKTIILVIIFLISGFAFGQIEKGKLVLGKTFSHSTNSLQKHLFQLELDQDQFVFLKLVQKGVDLQITVFDVNDKKIADFDSPNGTNGPELVQFESSEKGIYRIEVYPFNKEAVKGDYEISLALVEPLAIDNQSKVDQAFAIWNQKNGPGAAIAIQQDGEILYSNGYGLANLEYDIHVEPSTIFHIASVSKQFTAFSILLLEADGKLSIDDDIRKFIPEIPDFGSKITLKHLATHTSGLRDQWNLLAMAGWRLDDVITKEHVMKLVSKQQDLNFEPGEEMVYCNTGFTLLAEVVTRVSGKSFAEFTEERIFRPLKMSNTLFYDDHEKIVKNRAYSYSSNGQDYKKSVLSYANVGATSLFTTVEDLSLWANNFSDIKVGNKDIIKSLNTRAVLNNGDTIAAAKGQFIGEYKGLNEISHGGADAGYRTFFTRFPDQNFSVAVFGNSSSFNSGQMAYKIVDVYLKDHLQEQETKPESEMTNSEGFSLSPEVIQSYLGDFELQPGFVISVSEEAGKLYAQATGQSRVSLAPITETQFKVDGVEATIYFQSNGVEQIDSFTLHQGGQEIKASRLDPFDKDKTVLENYTGDFHSEELSTTYHFIIKNGKLVAEHSRLSDIELTPAKEDFFSGNQWFFGTVEFVRNTEKEIIGCNVSSGRVRNLKFKKID